MTPDQLAASTAVMILDPDEVAKLDDETLRSVLEGLVRMPGPGPEGRDEAQAASRRYLDEIM